MDNKLRVEQFSKFYDTLMSNAPEGFKPWLFPCAKQGKNPAPDAILKIDSKSKGSWHHESARLTKEQAIEHINQGWNIGISARENDPLIIGDIDEVEYLNQCPNDTLSTTSRKRVGVHFFGWDKDGSAKKNIPTEYGELRSSNQYVLASGSYVPFNLKDTKDKKAFDKLPKEAREDTLQGYYTVRNALPLKQMTYDDLPQFFKDKQREDEAGESEVQNREEQKEIKDGKYTELLRLKMSDIIEAYPSTKRKGHPLHESDTDANFSMSKDGSICHCWRHMVSLNAIQFLAVKSGYAKCEDAGTPHKTRGGVSKIKGDKKALESAYKEAVKMDLISKNLDDVSNEQKRFLTWVEKFNSYVVNIEATADYFCGKYEFLTVRGKTKDYLKRWDGMIWVDDARSFIREQCELLLGKHAKINPLNEIIAKIERRKYISMDEFEKDDPNFIPLENGILDVQKKELIKYSSDFFFKTIIPVTQVECATCDTWLKFLDEALYPEDIKVMQEWFGFNLYRRYLIKKAVICLGERDTGKTVLLDSLIGFVGEKNKTGLSLQKISSGNDFVKLSLKDKLSNVYDDLSSKDMNDGGNFKIATGGGWISGEEKFGDYQQFKNYAKHTLAGNKAPPVKDNDDMAYYDRWLVFRFDNPAEKKDLFLKEKILAEKSGILNWALDGLYRLLENGKFSDNKTPEEIKKILEMSGDPLIQFGEAVLERTEGQVTKEEMYEIYSIWANENDKPLLSKEQLGRSLNQKIKYLVAKVGAKERFWDNVKLKPEWANKIKKQPENKNIDTLDTFENNTRKCNKVNGVLDSSPMPLDIIFSKASNPSKTLKIEEIEDLDFSEVNLDE